MLFYLLRFALKIEKAFDICVKTCTNIILGTSGENDDKEVDFMKIAETSCCGTYMKRKNCQILVKENVMSLSLLFCLSLS